MKYYYHIIISSILILMIISPNVQAQAYCALRDPMSTIHRFAPESNGHRSIVREVDHLVRNDIQHVLPFTIHFNELGKHTLYVILNETIPSGLVHARSEKGRWGLVEIVWFLDLELKIQGFRYLRCRDRAYIELENQAFQAQIKGKGFTEIRAMLNRRGSAILPGELKCSAQAEALLLTTMQSALKTIVVTKMVWDNELLDLRTELWRSNVDAEQSIDGIFPTLYRVMPVGQAYTRKVMFFLNRMGQAQAWGVDRETVVVSHLLDEHWRSLGLHIDAVIYYNGQRQRLGWTITGTGKIVDIAALSESVDAAIVHALNIFKYVSDEELSYQAWGYEVAMASEVLAISRAHLNRF